MLVPVADIQRVRILQRSRCGASLDGKRHKRADGQSWGTKGSDKVSEDLGVVKSDNKDEVTVEVPVEQHDINAMYAAELNVLATKGAKEVRVVSDDQKQEDYYKNFRTNVSSLG